MKNIKHPLLQLAAYIRRAWTEPPPPPPPTAVFRSSEQDPVRKKMIEEMARTRCWLYGQEGHSPEDAIRLTLKWAAGTVWVENGDTLPEE